MEQTAGAALPVPRAQARVGANTAVSTLVLTWAAWLVALTIFQVIVPLRFEPRRPDYVLEWTANETGRNSQDDKIYLVEPFMNGHVSWDSEFYLSIATVGYDDPAVRAIPDPATGRPLSLNYAFFPGYPYAIRLLAAPLRALGLNPIAAATLGGVLVSGLGALGAMLALYSLARAELGDAAGLRGAFYLLIFPTGFFLAQVYTEGLFLGLAFGSLALARRGHWLWAALLAMLAAWTRPTGLALTFGLGVAWLRVLDWAALRARQLGWRPLLPGLAVLAPVVAYLVWKASFLGYAFEVVEDHYFGRGLFAIGQSLQAWFNAWGTLDGAVQSRAVYYAIEFAAVALGLIACAWALRRYPELAAFGLVVIVVSVTSGQAQGMHRYVLAAAPIFLLLARLGQSPAFDRIWTVVSVLLMGLLATLFTFDMWVG